MSLPLQPLTELDAVNILLMTIGERPVTTLETDGLTEVSIARHTLHQISRQVQAEGLRCNSEKAMPLVPDLDGIVRLPDNTLKAVPSDPYQDLVVRGGRLYDRANHTFHIGRTVKVDIVLFLPFEDLPQVVRDYITIRASRVFQAKILGSDVLYQYTVDDEQQAYLAMIREEIDSGNFNMLDAPDVRLRLRRS